MSRLPAVRDGMLAATPDTEPLPVGAPAWFAWLQAARSFTFASTHGTFTARHETRSGGHFWYAYRRQAGRLRKAYLGRAAELTLDRLEHAAQTLAADARDQEPAPIRSPNRVPPGTPEPLIATKCMMPQPGPSLIARPDVLARCLESIEHPCAILAAPAGFGKTTLLVMACDHLRAHGWRIAWLSLEESEQDPARFWIYVLAALETAIPGIAASLRPMIETPRPRPIEHLLIALVNAVAQAPAPLALVLDDYHRAQTPASAAGLAFLIEHLPATLHLVITARADPALPLARLRAQGRIAEMHAAEMRFSADEAERFLRETMHVALPADQVARLEQRTEGWVAGLQLAALSWREQGGSPDLNDLATVGESVTPRYIAEYLVAEVLDHQPETVQSFLLQTSVLERLSGPLCDAVAGRSDSAALLARLMRAQLFVTPLDTAQTWYRYHHLFADVLRERLERTTPELWEQCHRRAAEWLRARGMTGEAIRHLTTARAFAEAAELIEAECDHLVVRGEIMGLVAWVRALPRTVVLAHPHLCALFAVALLLMSEGVEATAWVERLERQVRETGSQTSELAGEIAAARSIILLMGSDFAGGARLAREAMKLLAPGDSLLRGLALWITSIVGILGDEDFDEILANMTRIAGDSTQTGNILMAYMALGAKAAVELYQGRLHQAAQTCRDALRLNTAGAPELPLSALAHCLLGDIRREWNDLEGAEVAVRHGFAVAAAITTSEFVNDGYVTLARIQAAHGQFDEALATFENLSVTIRTQQLVSWDLYQVEIARVSVLIAAGRVAEAVRWAESCRRARRQGDSPALPLLMRELEDVALARVALACGRPNEVLAPLEEVCGRATRAGRMRNVLEARILLARARWMLDERQAALGQLDFALALAAPEGFMRVFLDEGERLIAPLAAYAAARPSSREREHARALLAALGHAGGGTETTETDDTSTAATRVEMSERELEVLRLLARGRSNEAIAAELVVALSTVKWHVAHIYRKLGVSGRVQAAARARELRLIA